VRLRAPVATVETGAVTLLSGERLKADAVVVAADDGTARLLLGRPDATSAGAADRRGVACLYFAADESPIDEPILILNGEGGGPINNLCVPSAAAPSYAPPGAALVSASVNGEAAAAVSDARLEEAVREQLAGWFGPKARGWRHLRTYRIDGALPWQPEVSPCTHARTRTHLRGVYACGDHLDTASINGAMRAGRLAAEAVVEDVLGANAEVARVA